MTQLTVLGGSAAGVGTGQGCSGYLVKTDNTNLVLDLGPDTLLELRKHTDYRTLDGIVVSHLHMDHILDLFALRFALAYNPVSAPKPIPLYLPPGGLVFFNKAADLFASSAEAEGYFSAVFEMQEYDPSQKITIGDCTLTFMPTVHVVPCWAIRARFGSETGDLLYTADTGSDADFSGFAVGAAVVIAEAAAPPDTDPEKIRKVHLTPQQAAGIAKQAGAHHLVLTHIWEENGPDAFADAARELYAGQVTIARPGVSLTW